MLAVIESVFTFAVVLVILRIVYFGYNQLLSSCYEMFEDHSVYNACSYILDGYLLCIFSELNKQA